MSVPPVGAPDMKLVVSMYINIRSTNGKPAQHKQIQDILDKIQKVNQKQSQLFNRAGEQYSIFTIGMLTTC